MAQDTKKTDPKDERIAELEMEHEELEKQLQAATERAQVATALNAEIAKLEAKVAEKDKELEAVRTDLRAMREAAGGGARSTVSGLDQAKALQLRVSRTTTNALTGARIDASAGDVLAEQSAFAEVQKKVGAAATIHPVTAADLSAARKAGHAY